MISTTRTRRVAAIGAGAALAALGFAATVSAPTTAEARVFVGVGFGFGVPIGSPFYYPPYSYPYYYPPPYYPPPAYPAPSAYAPSGGYPLPASGQTPKITYTKRPAWTDASGRRCREYKTRLNTGGRPTTSYGTACRDPDGQWRVVN